MNSTSVGKSLGSKLCDYTVAELTCLHTRVLNEIDVEGVGEVVDQNNTDLSERGVERVYKNIKQI